MSQRPFVGRQRELELLRGVPESATPAAVTIAGDAGIGKSRLAREAMTIARDILVKLSVRSRVEIALWASKRLF